jgi:hypothetical protein
MAWVFATLLITLLMVFNVFAADGMIRIQRELKEVHKVLLETNETRKNSSA